MAAPVILVDASPRRASDAVVVPVALAGGGAVLPYPVGYRSGVKGLPTIFAALDFADQEMGGGGVPQATGITFAPAQTSVLALVASHHWRDAPIAIRIGPEGAGVPPVVLAGTVLEAPVQDGMLQIALADPAAALKRPMLVDRFAGTSGIEGPVELTGVAKPRCWGRCFNVPGRMLDQANNIVCFGDPARRWQAFDAVRDRGALAEAAKLTVVGWQGSIAATFAALKAAVPIAGGGVLAPDIACLKWWTDPADMTADVRGEIAGGYVETAAEIAVRIVAARSALAFAAGTVAAAVAARPAIYGRRVDDESTTVADLLSDILGDVSTSWVLEAGAIVLRPWEWSAPAIAAKSVAVTRRATLAPVATRKLGYRRNHHPVSRGDLVAIVFASDGRYADGTSFETLKPAEPGATLGAKAGSTLVDSGGATLGDAAIKNANVSIGANGTLSGAGGGQVTFTGIGGGPVGTLSSIDLGGGYASGTLPTTRAASGLVNINVSIGANGTLAGGGGGQVTFSGIGGGIVGTLSSVDLGGSYASGTLPTARAASGLVNLNVSIGANGVLAGGGGGQVTFTGIGGGVVGTLSSIDLAGAYASGTLPASRASAGLVNLNVSIGANGTLAGGGGGQVTIGGLGFRGDLAATRNDDTANMIPAPTDPTTWVFLASATSMDRGDNSRPIGRYAARLPGEGAGVVFSPAAAIRNITPGEVLFVRYAAQADGNIGSAADYLQARITIWNEIGQAVTSALVSGATVTAGQLGNDLMLVTGNVVVPQGAARVTLFVQRSGDAGGAFFVGEPYLGRAQPGADVTAAAPIVRRLDPVTGRAVDTRLLNASNAFGLRSLSQPPGFSAAVSGDTATITLDGNGVYYTDWLATIALPSASFPGLAQSTQYYFWRNMPVDGAGDSYGYSTALTAALGTGKSYFGNYTTPSAAGTGGGGGYYGGTNCVAADAWVPTGNRGTIRARDIVAGDMLYVLTSDLDGITTAPCTGNQPGRNDVCRLIGSADACLTLAINTPMTLRDRTWVVAANAWGRPLALMTALGQTVADWRPVADVEGIGVADVAAIACNNGTFAASDRREGPFIFSHNLQPQKP